MKGEGVHPEVLADLVDLYEYKVEALAQGLPPKGGKASLLRLRQTLLSVRLSPRLAKRFRAADKLFRSLRPAAPPPEAPIPLPELEKEPLPDNVDELRRGLSLEVWRIWVEKELKERAKGFLEGEREAIRLLYSFLQNFQTYQKTPGFNRDFALNRFIPQLPIPPLYDPIAELDNREVAVGLLLEFLEAAFHLTDRLPLPPEETRTYFRRAFRKLLENEAVYPVGPRPDLRALQRALEEGRRLGLSAKDLEALEGRLRQAAQEERRLSLLLEEDKRRFSMAAEKLLALLSLLPTPKGEVPWPEIPAPGERRPGLLTLPLRPGRVELDGLELTLSKVGEAWYLGVSGEDHPLGNRMILPMGDLEVWVVRQEDLLHLRLEARASARLYELLGEGRVLAYLLYPGNDFAYLRLLRALSARLKGESLSGFGPELAQKYRQAPPDALQDFARKGLEVMTARLKGQDPLPLLEGVGRALGLEPEARTLGAILREHLRRKTPTRETLGQEVGTLSLAAEPQTLKLGSQVLWLRPAEEGVYVGMVGQVPRRLKDLLIYPLPQGQLVLAREGGRVAYLLVVP